MNKIIFWNGIWPDWYTRSIGPYQLGHWLRQNKIESQVIDFCQWYSAEELVSLTEPFIKSSTEYIGISTSFWPDNNIPRNIESSIQIIKKEYPQIKFIFGGPRADNECVKKIADIVLVGEAENSLLSLIKGNNLHSLFDITKLEHRFTEKDCIIDGEVLPIELGRGCIFKCKFCSHHNLGKPKHTYQRNFKLIEDEIVYNYEKFKTVYYNFLDDTVNEDRDKIVNLAQIPSRTGINISWNGYLRADLIWSDQETAELLKQSGLKSCFFGIETFHQRAGSSIGKGWSGKHGKTFLPYLYEKLWNKEINIWCNFIVGLPYETENDLENTLEWCKNNPIGIHRFVPLSLYTSRTDSGSKSEFTENYKDYGYELDENGQWKNSYLNFEKSLNLSKKYNQVLLDQNKLTGWLLFDCLNLDIDLNVLKNLNISFRNINFKLFDIFLKKYKKKLQEIS